MYVSLPDRDLSSSILCISNTFNIVHNLIWSTTWIQWRVVVCRLQAHVCVYLTHRMNAQIFLTTGAIAYTNAYFGRGTGGIFLDNVGCSGSESTLLSCYNPGIGYHNCRHSDDAGVRCLGNA